MTGKPVLETRTLKPEADDIAPDGSEICLMCKVSRGNMAHCILPAGVTSAATKHKTIEELWYFLSGEGRIWRRLGEQEVIVEARAGVGINIPTGTTFQFQNTGAEPLCIIIVAMPPWPGKEESIPQEPLWEVRGI